MCSTAKENVVTLSDVAHLKLGNLCKKGKFKPVDVEMKGKGIMLTFQCLKMKIVELKKTDIEEAEPSIMKGIIESRDRELSVRMNI